MAFIGLGAVDRNLIAIILSCIFCLLNRFINQLFQKKLLENKVYTNIVISFAESFIVIPYIIYRKRSKGRALINAINNIDSNEEEKKFEYIYEEPHDIKDDVRYKELYIILISIIFFINYSMFIYTFPVKSNIWITYILFTSIFYYLIFKAKLYNYHYLSIIIILLTGFIIDIVQANFQNDWESNEPEREVGFIFSIVRVILLSFNYVIIKYTIEKKFASPYEIGAYSGIIDLILFIIFALLDYKFFNLNPYNYDYFEDFDAKTIFYFLCLMVTNLGIFLCCLIIVKNNTPCHIFIMFIIGQTAYFTQEIGDYIIVVIIGLIIMLFFSLVFNEIIELNFCGLSRNTKKNINYRAKNEIIESNLIKSLTIEEDNDINPLKENANEIHIINED